MNKINFPLKPRMKRPEVGNLQEALQLLLDRAVLLADNEAARDELSGALKEERVNQTYGGATGKLVSRFQEERRLAVTGQVDKPTANAINTLLREWGVLDQEPVNTNTAPLDPRFTVVCRAVDVRGKPIAGLRIEAFDQDPKSPHDPLGEPAITDSDGLATFRFKGSDYSEHPGEQGPDLYFKVFRDEVALEYVLPGIRNDKGVIRNFQPQREPIVLRVDKHQVLTGVILEDNGLPAEKLTLSVRHLGFGGKTPLLGIPITDALGRYALAYDPGEDAVNLEVRVKDPGDPQKTLPLVKPCFAAAAHQVLNLVAPAAPLEAEYLRLTADLKPHVGRMTTLAGAREDKERRDLTVLNRATGWDARLIALAATAERLSANPEVKLPQEAVYGLLRAGLPSDRLLLAQVEPDVVEQTLKTVRDAGIVALSDPEIGQFKERFQTFANTTRFNIPAPGSRSTYGALLKTSGLPQEAQEKFVPVYLNHRGTPDQLWEKVREAGLEDTQIGKLQLQGKLAFLAGNSEAMTARLLQKRLDDPVELLEQDFHRAETWESEVLAAAGIPNGRRRSLSDADKKKLDELIPIAYAAEKVEDRLHAYTEDMARKVRLSYPTQVVGRMIETEELALPTARDATVKLLNSAAKHGFRLGETPAANFFKTQPGVTAGLAGSELQEAQLQLQTLQRVYQITPGNEAMPVLMSLGMTSAYDVTTYPKDKFETLFEDRYRDLYKRPTPPGLPQLVRRKAEQVSSVTYNLFTIARKMDSDPPIAGLSAPVEVRESVRSELIKQFPTMESLFGSLDFCQCEHCRSVLSPAAYLVDLLQFIDPESGVWGNFLANWKTTHGGQDYPHKKANGEALKPYDVLSERRPDLPYIPLTCENTHTALPYIDIVNEILEYYVAHGKLEDKAAHDTGTATTAELLAEPQNVIRQAYDTLAEARYPLGLPFDPWIQVVRQFCNYFETPLDRVLEVFRPGDELFAPGQPFDRASIFMESLGLAPVESAIFTNPNPLTDWHLLYGYSSEPQATTPVTDADTGQRIDLNSAKALARRLGVTYQEITEVVRTGFVNPKLVQLHLLYKLGVSIHDARFYLDHKNDPPPVTAEEQKRHLEVQAFARELAQLAGEFNVPAAQLEASLNAIPFNEILVLADPDTGCNFDRTTLRCADGSSANPIDFLRINLFVRLWCKLGWSIEETDRALTTFIPSSAPFDDNPAHLCKQPLKTAFIYLAHLKDLEQRLRVGKQGRLKLLTLWSDLATTGKDPLYAQLFLTRSLLKSAPVFDSPLGQFLTDPAIKLKNHLVALQGALGLTAEDIYRILEDAGKPLDTTVLSLPNVSLLYRYGLLARALKLMVRQLIALKQLSGLDPFMPLPADPLTSIAADHPFSQTLRFCEIAGQVKESGLTGEDLDYLLRHRFDETGKYRPDPGAGLVFLESLSQGIRTVLTEHTLPEDAGALSEEMLRQKLGLGLSPDVVERFLAMINGTAEFTAAKSGVAPAQKLDPQVFAGEPALREIQYNETRQEQKLTFRGVLLDPQKTALQTTFNPALTPAQRVTWAELLEGVKAQAREFFDLQLKKQTLRRPGEAGFLEESDFDFLFQPLTPLQVILPTDTPLEVETKLNQNASIEAENHATEQQRRYRVASAFLPYLQQRLIRQFILREMTAHTGAEPGLLESLVTDERLLAGPGSNSLLVSLSSSAEQGVDALFFDSVDLTGAPQATPPLLRTADTALKASRDPLDNLLNPSNSARFQGYLQVPAPGAYRFYIQLDRQNSEAELRFPHLPDPLFLKGTAGSANTTLGHQASEFLELKPGIPYGFSLELTNLGGGAARLLVQGETVPRGDLDQLSLYPQSTIAGAEQTLLRLSKALQLVQALGLSEREIRYLSNPAADFDRFNLGDLPTRPVGDTPAEKVATRERFNRFLRLADYARLKRDLAAGTDDLIAIFEANELTDNDKLDTKVYPLIAKLTRRDEAVVKAAADALVIAPSVPAFASEKPLARLWEALQVIERFGVPVTSLLEWTRIVSAGAMPGQRFNTARALREAIKARFEPETWQRVAQPIFDKLRQQQRDALVSHVMHQLGFARLEQLYEYFLIDPGMEPVVQTSRIRLASASVQLFIQRCLLNLELKVHPSTINSKQWEWMKRYRVWEANRKIFLFPENWLEPEFRDDKTHLFTELEGALFQGDVSGDLVEDAFLNYLKKLEELARLDIVAMHIEDDSDPARRTLHVFGRTYSQPHKYFYRRYAHQAWTPWEPVSAEIEGDHLAPVVWRDRLYLFWVTFLDKPVENPQPTGTAANSKLNELTLKNSIGSMQTLMATKIVEIQLHWSEYVQGEWSTRQSGGLSAVIAKTVASNFKPDSVFIHVSKAYDEETGEDRGVYLSPGGRYQSCLFPGGSQ